MFLEKIKSPIGLLFFLYYTAIGIILITLYPYNLMWPPINQMTLHVTLFDFVMNILLFVPFGFLAMMAGPKLTSLFILGLGFVLSSFIEVSQTMLPERFPSWIDLGTNTLGSWLGAVVYLFLSKRIANQLIPKMALELPLMGIFYLATPLFWLGSIVSSNHSSQIWIYMLPLFATGIILVSIWERRLKYVISSRGAIIALSFWLILSLLPFMSSNALVAIQLAFIVGFFLFAYWYQFKRYLGNERRFEKPVLIWIWGCYLVFLGLKIYWPITSGGEFGTLHPISEASPDAQVPILILVEHFGLFTILGFLMAETLGRQKMSLKRIYFYAFNLGLLSALVFEIAQSMLFGTQSSVVTSLVAGFSSLFGAFVYRAQLKEVLQLLGK